MVRKVLFIFICLFFISSGCFARGLEKDKILHIAGSCILYQVTFKVLDNFTELSFNKKVIISSAVVISVGIAKETIDPVFDEKDLGADVLGNALGIGLSFPF